MKTHSVPELAKEKGNVAFKVKDYATARSLYSHAMTFNRSNHNYPLNRSFANMKLARWDEAEADATQTLVLSPCNLKALFRRGVARKELGKWDQAREDIQMFIDNGGDPTIGAQEFKSISNDESSPSLKPSSYTSSDLDSNLANLNLQDDSSFFTIHTSTAVQDGKGAFASRDIQRGDLILSEKPILSIRGDVPEPLKIMSIEVATQKLSPIHLDQFLSLQNSHAECTCFPNPYLLGLFLTNAHTLGEETSDLGVFPKASRFNHSCSPNAKFSFNSITGELRIYALGPIPRGEEIFTAYINGNNLYGKPRRLRQAKLRDLLHFTCACTICSLSEAESKKSDSRRMKINKVWETVQKVDPSPSQGNQVLDDIVEALHLLMQEGYLADTDDFSDYAASVCALHSDFVSAQYWAGLKYHTRVAEFGEDSPLAEEARVEYPNPRSFPFADANLLRNLMRYDPEYNS